MIKLNDDTIYVGQIKQILHSFNLPMFSIYQNGSTYALGEHYLKDNDIYVWANVYNEQGEIMGEREEFVKHYKFGEFIDGLTTRFPISSNIYDSKTHIYLGNYLRFIRDYLGMDLMSMYNCCGYDSPRDFDANIVVGGHKVEFNTNDPEYTLIMVPVRKGKKYTIGIDYHGDIEMACMHFENNFMLENQVGNEYKMLSNTYAKIRGARFNHPYLYDKLSELKHDKDTLESTLKLFIKIPSSCNSSIVVLEGDYRKCSNDNLFMDNLDDNTPNTYKQKLGDALYLNEFDGSDNLEDLVKNYDYVTKNDLLSINMGQKNLLSTRLVEYLSKHAIAPNSDVVDNIKRLQRTLASKIDSYHIKQYGVWDDSMKRAIYRYLWDTKMIHNYKDLLSYFDKDVETKIGELLSKYNDNKVFTHGEMGGK